MKKIMLGTSDAWWTSHSSQQPSKPAYYIVDCLIYRHAWVGCAQTTDLAASHAQEIIVQAGQNHKQGRGKADQIARES